MSENSVGELEHLVLLTILVLGEDATALRLRRTLAEEGGRTVTRGALYRSLDRLGEKRMLEWATLAPTEDRGGHARRVYRVSATGLEVLRERRATLERLWAGAAGALEG